MEQEALLPRRIAIVHEWFTSMRGGEKCVEALCELLPDADVFALLHVPGSVTPPIERAIKGTTFIQHLPGAATHYRRYLPLFPFAIRQLHLQGYNLVISSHHCVAKGARVPSDALHLCYCYTPMRYIWGQYDEYFGKGRADMITRMAMRMVVGPLRRWDLRTAKNPRHFVAISENVRTRIKEIYGRTSDMIYPPVDTGLFPLSTRDDGYDLVVSALVPYKAVDLAIEAFNRTGDRLVIVGQGPDRPRLERMAKPNITFAGWQPDDRLAGYYAGCRALIFPGEEDFGIVPLEAMASGKPVLAYARGGALETVLIGDERRTGVLFHDQSVEGLLEGLAALRKTRFDPHVLREHALTFDREVYKTNMRAYIARRWAEFKEKLPQAQS
jgi:glycosyltransferase involved in cell wall biosynthesis